VLWDYQCNCCAPTCTTMHYVTINKTDAIYMVCGRIFSTHVHNTPSWPGLFLSDRPEFLERGEVFKQTFSGVGPSKQGVSMFFTRLLHRPGPLTSTMIQIERLRFRHIWSMMTRSIHDCWHLRTNKCVRTNICKTPGFVFSVRFLRFSFSPETIFFLNIGVDTLLGVSS